MEQDNNDRDPNVPPPSDGTTHAGTRHGEADSSASLKSDPAQQNPSVPPRADSQGFQSLNQATEPAPIQWGTQNQNAAASAMPGAYQAQGSRPAQGFQPGVERQQVPVQQWGNAQPTQAAGSARAPQGQQNVEGGYAPATDAPASYPPASSAPYVAPQPFPQAPKPPRRPLPKKTKFAIGGSIIAIILAIVALWLFVFGGLNKILGVATQESPEGTVKLYLSALNEGDANSAWNLVDESVRSQQPNLVSNDVYRGAKNRPELEEISDVRDDSDNKDFLGSDEGNERATVIARVKQGESSHPVTFHLKLQGSKTWVLQDIESSVISFQDAASPLPGADKVKINGVDVEVKEETTALTTLPGDYTVTPPAATDYVAFGDPQEFTVPVFSSRDDNTVDISFTPSFTDKAITEAIKQVQDKLAECMASNKFVTGCHMVDLTGRGSSPAITDIKRSWSTQPEVTSSGNSETGTNPLDGTSVVIGNGTLRVTYKQRYSESEPWEAESNDISVYGGRYPVKLDKDGKVTVDLGDGGY
ncbi:MAG: hypothetical protein SPI12_03340 [Actinomycetaceae bacterium]|nr:hypothetical protein [Actinomycetaceae bacterium]MDY6082880.1 hypothetical protein [Actinomycetaceae bacterium]